jgi:4-azaleucine resistance transporter AzlC
MKIIERQQDDEITYLCRQTNRVPSASLTFRGAGFWILLSSAGYPPVWSFLSALFIYAGSMQIVMVTLMTSGAPIYMVAVMTFLVNARHIFYGISFIGEFRDIGRKQKWKYPYMALTLTDETYSVLCSMKCPENLDKQKIEFYVLFLSHMLWILSCSAGALIGSALPVDMTGIDFSATAFFAAVVIDQWRLADSHIPAIVGLVSAVVFFILLGADNFILPALSASVIALALLKEHVKPRALEGSHE